MHTPTHRTQSNKHSLTHLYIRNCLPSICALCAFHMKISRANIPYLYRIERIGERKPKIPESIDFCNIQLVIYTFAYASDLIAIR